MANFTTKLTNITVKVWFPPTMPIEEVLIENGVGTFTASIFGTSIGYYLQVDSGDRVNTLILGQPVTVTGVDSDGRQFSSDTVLETTSVGEPALFKGPYEAAIKSV